MHLRQLGCGEVDVKAGVEPGPGVDIRPVPSRWAVTALRPQHFEVSVHAWLNA